MTKQLTLAQAAQVLARKVNKLKFAGAVAYVYNPLDYAWAVHKQYLELYGTGKKRVIMMGMNPGPFGMMQTGVPFGEVAAVRDWMHLDGDVMQPKSWHPKRPIEGLACERSEVSGRRLWGWAADQFGDADTFFSQTFVVNYCPLVFLESGGRNLTPDKLPIAEHKPLQAACDEHLKSVIAILEPEWLVGVGAYAAKRLQQVAGGEIETGKPEKPRKRSAKAAPNESSDNQVKTSASRSEAKPGVRIGQILHPSPASPLANKGWSAAARATIDTLGIY